MNNDTGRELLVCFLPSKEGVDMGSRWRFDRDSERNRR